MDFENLSPELKEKALACKSTDELFELAKSEGIELSDEQIAAISGGQSWGCDTYVYHECKDDYSPGRC